MRPPPRWRLLRRCRRTGHSFWTRPSQGHSVHVGQEVVVHYRWHALYGRQLRRQRCERRAGGDVVHVEVAPGVVTVVAAWMLDAIACANMEIGAPRVAVPALADLHRLLATLGFRTDLQGDSTVALGSSDEINTAESAAITAADDDVTGRQEPMGDDDGRARGRGQRARQAFAGGGRHIGRGEPR